MLSSPVASHQARPFSISAQEPHEETYNQSSASLTLVAVRACFRGLEHDCTSSEQDNKGWGTLAWSSLPLQENFIFCNCYQSTSPPRYVIESCVLLLTCSHYSLLARRNQISATGIPAQTVNQSLGQMIFED